MIYTDDIIKIIREFAQRKTDDVREELKRKMLDRDRQVGGKGHISLSLAQSVAQYIYIFDNLIDVGVQMDYYGLYVDVGVKGSESSYQESLNSKHAFKDKAPPVKVFSGAGGWIARKGIIDRGVIAKETGKKGKELTKAVISRNKSLAYLISQSIKRKGIKAYHFTDVLFEQSDIDKLINTIMNVIGNDIITRQIKPE